MPISYRFGSSLSFVGMALGLSLSLLAYGQDSVGPAEALREAKINQALQEFSENPSQFMNSQASVRKYDPETGDPILFYDPETGVPLDPTLPFSTQDIQTQDYILKKGLKDPIQGRAQIGPGDKPEQLVFYPQNMLWTLEDMEKANLKSNRVRKDLWSGDYWPTAKGGIARRYADPYYPSSLDWLKNYNYFQAPVSSSIEYLSPAEKYDLLVGDAGKTLTRAMLGEGFKHYSKWKNVELWNGFCDGWAVASYLVPRPKNLVQVLAADGKTWIPFYPSDIKALATLLWARAIPQVRQMGARCRIKNPPTDANGRIIPQQCFETNPGSWHLALINQMKENETFAFDATYDYEVWNHPAESYSYSYFNPQTMRYMSSLQEATVSREAFTSDKFSKYRSPQAASFVGIAMKLTYLAETMASRNKVDHPNLDRKIAVDYFYDLEMDSTGKIIGGEWYQNKHPDFVWTPPPGAVANSSADIFLNTKGVPRQGEWNGTAPIPSLWKNLAPQSSRYSQPIARIVETLAVLSQVAAP